MNLAIGDGLHGIKMNSAFKDVGPGMKVKAQV